MKYAMLCAFDKDTTELCHKGENQVSANFQL